LQFESRLAASHPIAQKLPAGYPSCQALYGLSVFDFPSLSARQPSDHALVSLGNFIIDSREFAVWFEGRFCMTL